MDNLSERSERNRALSALSAWWLEKLLATETKHIIFDMYYVYLLKNLITRNTYIGYTSDLEKRIRQHKNKQPKLIYYEAYKDERDARERERKLKQRGQTVRRLKERLKYSLS